MPVNASSAVSLVLSRAVSRAFRLGRVSERTMGSRCNAARLWKTRKRDKPYSRAMRPDE